MEQGTFEDIAIQELTARAKALGHEWEKRLKAVALSVNRTRLATICDVSYSYLSDIINTNNEAGQKPWPTKLTGALMVLAQDRLMEEAVDFVCDVCGRQPTERKRALTPEEELKRMWEIVRQHGLQSLFQE